MKVPREAMQTGVDTRCATEGSAEKNGDSHQLRTLRRIIIGLALQLVTVTVFQEPDGAQLSRHAWIRRRSRNLVRKAG